MVMNEKERVKNLLEKGDFSDNIYGDIQLLVRYYVNEEKLLIKEEIMERVVGLLEDQLPIFYEWEWEDTIEKIIKQELNHPRPLTSINAIYVTEEEISTIRTLKKATQRKYLFALIVYARYLALKKEIDSDWTYSDRKSQEAIIKSANNNGLTFKDQHVVAKELIDLGLIAQPKKMESLSLKVICMNDKEGNIALWVNSFEDLGNYIEDYLKVTYGGYKVCEVCGKPYKPTGRNSKYCNPCKKEMEKERKREWKAKQKDK